MVLVKLKLKDGTPLNTTRVGEFDFDMRDYSYFDISIPVVGSVIKYHKFNGEDVFEGNSQLYKVLDVTQELQEYYNDLYKERFIATVEYIKEDSGYE